MSRQKKASGGTLKGRWVSSRHSRRHRRLHRPLDGSCRAARSKRLPGLAGTRHEQVSRFGKGAMARPTSTTARFPRDWWLEDWEKQAILDYHDSHPLDGYRRLAFMMLDDDIVARSVSSSVYRVLKAAGRLDHRTSSPSKKGTRFRTA